jgi:hypothetical protein
VLTDEERATLTRWSRRAKSSQVLAMRSWIILVRTADRILMWQPISECICPLWARGGGDF